MDIKIKKTKLFFIYFIFAALFLIFSILMAPVWHNVDASWIFWKEWGAKGAYLVIAMFLLFYLFGYLFKRMIKNKNKSVYIPTIVEFTIISVFAAMCIINQLTTFMSELVTASIAIGLVLYIHGLIDLIVLYFRQSENKKIERVGLFFIDILFITLGVWCVVADLIPLNVVIWLFSLILFVLFVTFVIFGFIAKPKRIKKDKEQKESESK